MAKLEDLLAEALKDKGKRKFRQAVELMLTFNSNRTKPVTFNEIIYVPHPIQNPSRIYVIAGGDVAVEAKKLGYNLITPEDVDRLATNKREAKKLARRAYAFLAEASLMPRIGKALGAILAPRGKMPITVPNAQALDVIFKRVLASTRVRGRNVMGVQVKVGYEDMKESDILDNAKAVIDYIEKKLPPGSVKSIGFKLTMGGIRKLRAEEAVA